MFLHEVHKEMLKLGLGCMYISSVKTVQQAFKFGIGRLHWKLMGTLHFGLYWHSITPNVHEKFKWNVFTLLKNGSSYRIFIHEI